MEAVDALKPQALSEPDCREVEAIRTMWEAMYPARLFDNIDFQKLLYKHELMHEKSMAGSLYSGLSDPPKMSGAFARPSMPIMTS